MSISFGLKGIVALESNISKVDGQQGLLEYRGYNIHDLAKHSSFEEVVFLLWHGYLPTQLELEAFCDDLSTRRHLSPEIIGLLSNLNNLPKKTHPTVVLRTAVSYMGSLDEKINVINREENLEKSKNLLARLPTIVAYYHRIRERKPLIHPNNQLNHATNFLWMLHGQKPTKTEAKAMDLDLLLHAEHTLAASTFSARIAASTLSDMYAGVVSATGVLFGPLHGGATQRVIEMLRDIKTRGVTVEDWVEDKLANGERIMGFGHRVYKTGDPRTEELKQLSAKLDQLKSSGWYPLSQEIERVVKAKKSLYPNVDFYAASVYNNLGIPDDLFINVFALSRIAGWTIHMDEQYKNNKIIRPLQQYKGEKHKQYVPIEHR
jgi:citrate synthase